MNPSAPPRLAVLMCAVAAVAVPYQAMASSSAASIAAGGLAPVRNAGLVVDKQIVRISDRKIVVDYDVRNDSSADITTELEFAAPPYKDEWDTMNPAKQAFHSLHVWADDKPVELQAEARAELHGEDITKTLEKAHVDIASFGHLEVGRDQQGMSRTVLVADYERLSSKEKHRLREEGIFKGEEGYCLYTVHLRYHWLQSFPAHGTVHMRQEYVPVVGFMETPPQVDALQAALTPAAAQTGPWLSSATHDPKTELASFCTDAPFVQTMMRAQKMFAETWAGAILPHWVDYTLTSAGDWHKPIGDFTLVVEIPQPQNGQQTLVSFCSPGVVDKQSDGQLQVHLTNYTPGSDLHIGFFNAPLQLQGESVAAR